VRSAFWHALGDALASVGVIVGGAIIAFSRLYIIDPIVGALIGLIIVAAAWDIFRDGLRVLLEAKPAHLDMQELVSALKRLPGVKDVHDVHLWSITPALHAMSAHVLVDGKATPRLDAVRRSVEEVLKRDFGLAHTTLQMECQGCGDGEPLCQLIACQKREDNPLGPHKPE
jgi:cobalt-zinc-cadmium efflux system protein